MANDYYKLWQNIDRVLETEVGAPKKSSMDNFVGSVFLHVFITRVFVYTFRVVIK